MSVSVIVDAEDVLLAEMARRLLGECGGKYELAGDITIRYGRGNVDKNAPKWNNSAKNGNTHFVLCDLDTLAPPESENKCPQSEIRLLLGGAQKHPHFLLRFAVAEGENWLLADYDNLRKFLGIRQEQLPSLPDAIKDGKECLLLLARRSKKRNIREGMVPQGGAKVGPLWNSILSEFVRDKWRPDIAAKHSKSLRRTLARLKSFRPLVR